MKNINPHNLCTLDEQSDCTGCGIQGELACKWDKGILTGFHAIAWPPIIVICFSIVLVGFLTGLWWPLIAYLVYFFSIFGIFEIRFLCSHCPYYAEDSTILHCHANHGSLKLWRYHPEPMNRFEQFLMYVLIVTIFFVFPLAIQEYGIWFLSVHYAEYGLISLLGSVGIAVATLATSVSFVLTLRRFFCPKCINFSCPLNPVPKPVIDVYLKKNDVMRKAWEEAGWEIE